MISIVPTLALVAGLSIAAAAAPYRAEPLALPAEQREVAALLREVYRCPVKLEKGQSSLAVVCPEEGSSLVVRGRLSVPVKVLVEAAFLERAAALAKLPDSSQRQEPTFAAEAQIKHLLSTYAPACRSKEFPKSARCAAQVLAQGHRLHVGRGQIEEDGRYCESFFPDGVPSLFPTTKCDADVEAGFASEAPAP